MNDMTPVNAIETEVGNLFPSPNLGSEVYFVQPQPQVTLSTADIERGFQRMGRGSTRGIQAPKKIAENDITNGFGWDGLEDSEGLSRL